MECDEETGILEIKLTSLIGCVLNVVALDEEIAKGKYAHVGSGPLVNNEDGVPANGIFNYSSIVVMRIYLFGHTRPRINFAVNCCARYMFFPNHLHDEALKLIGQYLELTRDCGLILNPNRKFFDIDSYSDADFSGMYGHANL